MVRGLTVAAIDTLADHIRERALNLVREAADLTVSLTQEAASSRTGALREGITHDEPTLSDPYVSCRIVSAATYSEFQDEGTGIYGPSGTRIFPTTAKALRFDWPAAGGVVFAKSVAGSPGRHFFREPMPDRWTQALHERSGAFSA